MKHRSQEEIEAMARQAAERDIAALMESGLPITETLVKAMARQAAHVQAEADWNAPDEAPQAEAVQADPPHRSWLGKLFGR